MHRLEHLTLGDVTALAAGLRTVASGAGSLEEGAGRVVRHLHEQLTDGESRPGCALVRCYKLHPFAGLEPALQDFARKAIPGVVPVAETRCLTLLATAGARAEWKDRALSKGHKAIPLASAAVVQSLPMVAHLVESLGLDLASVVAPAPEIFVNARDASFNVFHVQDAAGSRYVPAQAEFVVPERVRSVVGFGFVLPPAELVAFILFSRVKIEPSVAQLFRSLALSVKLGLLPLAAKPVFAGAARS